MTSNDYKIKTALLSVSDKNGIVGLARELVEHNVTIYSTGGTMQTLVGNHIPVHSVSELTNFPEIMDGRVKTLHPAVHGGLLADFGNTEHIRQLEEHHIQSIDLLVVNLYPFEQVLKKEENKEENCVIANLIENIDIGGPTMLRSAAKNYRWSAVVVNPKHYGAIVDFIKKDGTIPEDFRLQLACEVFNHTAHYDAIIAGYFNRVCKIEYPETLTLSYTKAQDCRYGENPHQSAAVYGSFLHQFEKLHGKELSYNNVVDINSICELMLEFDKPTVAIVKHTNPCGVASADNLVEAYKLAFATDTESPYGGIIALNGTLDKAFAEEIYSLFAEVIIATSFTLDALEILTKKKDRRLVAANFDKISNALHYSFRSLPDGILYQQADLQLMDYTKDLEVVSKRQPTKEEIGHMLFAWKVVKHTKSNAIVYGGNNRTLGVGAGQMSRVESSRIAVDRAKQNNLDLTGCVCASDAFFPFPDALLEAVNAGATAVIQPGGSVRDAEVIAEADKHNIAMVFTGMRHFRH